MVTFAISGRNKTEATKKARAFISRKNKERDAFKPNPQSLKSVKKSPAGKTLGGRKFPVGTHFIVTTKSRKKR